MHNREALLNLAELRGAPTLESTLDVNGQDLVGVANIAGTPTLVVPLNVNGYVDVAKACHTVTSQPLWLRVCVAETETETETNL